MFLSLKQPRLIISKRPFEHYFRLVHADWLTEPYCGYGIGKEIKGCGFSIQMGYFRWLIAYQVGILSLSCSQYSLNICLSGWDDNTCLGVRNIGSWPNSLDRRPPWYCTVSPLLQTNKTNTKATCQSFMPELHTGLLNSCKHFKKSAVLFIFCVKYLHFAKNLQNRPKQINSNKIRQNQQNQRNIYNIWHEPNVAFI